MLLVKFYEYWFSQIKIVDDRKWDMFWDTAYETFGDGLWPSRPVKVLPSPVSWRLNDFLAGLRKMRIILAKLDFFDRLQLSFSA